MTSHNVYYVIGKRCWRGWSCWVFQLRIWLARADAGTAAFQAVRRFVLAWPAIAAGHFASRVDAILLDSLGIDAVSRHA